MSLCKRNFSDFEKFPGLIKQKYGNKIYVFPSVKSEDSMGRERFWVIFIRLIEIELDKQLVRRAIDWDLSQDSVVNITKKHYDKVAGNIIAQVWTEQGIVDTGEKKYKTTRSIPTHILKGKNIGKVNETNVFTQALIHARSKYLKKLEQTGHKEKVFPVAVHKYNATPKAKERQIVYPCAVQRKLDGGRAVAYNSKDGVILYTRKLKDLCGNKHIVDELSDMYKIINKKYEGAYLDGELYKHGLSLQQISGIMRRESSSKISDRELKNNTPLTKLEYHIFDVFFPFDKEKSKMSQENRTTVLNDIFKQYKKSGGNNYLKQVENFTANTQEEETKLYESFLQERYEGSIVKNLKALYEFGMSREIRSYHMRKRKPRYSDEYEIVGWTEGEKGKDKGAIIWVLKTKPKNKTPSIQFTSAPVGMTYETRYKMFQEMTERVFNIKYKGKMMTVEFDDISEEGVPLRAKAKAIRDID